MFSRGSIAVEFYKINLSIGLELLFGTHPPRLHFFLMVPINSNPTNGHSDNIIINIKKIAYAHYSYLPPFQAINRRPPLTLVAHHEQSNQS